MADEMIISMSTNAAAKEPINDPEVRSQKELNCWQIASQLALAFPLCAKYTMAAAVEAPEVTRASIACTIDYMCLNLKLDSSSTHLWLFYFLLYTP